MPLEQSKYPLVARRHQSVALLLERLQASVFLMDHLTVFIDVQRLIVDDPTQLLQRRGLSSWRQSSLAHVRAMFQLKQSVNLDPRDRHQELELGLQGQRLRSERHQASPVWQLDRREHSEYFGSLQFGQQFDVSDWLVLRAGATRILGQCNRRSKLLTWISYE